MCIAIVKPKGANISDEYLENSFDNNNDGAGIAYSSNNKLYIIKGIFSKKQFVDAVRKAEKLADGAMLIHCRIGTSGLKDKNNCHPHIISEKAVMIHNGILDIDVPKKSKESDTVIFVKKFLQDLPKDFMSNKGIINLIGECIGTHNKFCFLNEKGEYAIANEKQGIWDEGVWYSNGTYTYTYSYDYGYGYGFNTISNKEIDDVAEAIYMLEDYDFEILGQYPLWDSKTKQLVYWTKHNAKNCYYLDEIDADLQELYEVERNYRLNLAKGA